MSACYFQMSGMALAPETTCNVLPTYSPRTPPPARLLFWWCVMRVGYPAIHVT